MTVLSADAVIPWKSEYGSGVITSYPMADNQKVYKGSLVAIDAAGYARPAADTASYISAGIAVDQVDNTITGHTAGGLRIRVRSGVRAQLPATGLTQASVGQVAKVADSGAVAAAS